MTQDEIYQRYLKWEKGTHVYSREELFSSPSGNYDVYENEAILINRLYYLTPDFDGEHMRVFVFYEINTFLKDDDGDMLPIFSTYGIER